MQLGTFEPILRLHSNNENRLPWQYPQPVQGITESFLRLREALLPYSYTLAAEANQTGLPMARPLYLDNPGQPSAYQNPTEYLYGPDMLVAPVTTPGDVASTTVWFPPGKWVDFFTGATFTGPSSATLAVPLDRMPVFVRQGGIVPEQPSTGGTGPPHTLTALVYPGSPGSFDLYGDAGTGLGYTKGQRTETLISTSSSAPAGGPPSVRVTIGAARGSYPGEPTSRLHHRRDGRRHPTGPGHARRSEPQCRERVRPALVLPGVHRDTDRARRVAAGRSRSRVSWRSAQRRSRGASRR